MIREDELRRKLFEDTFRLELLEKDSKIAIFINKRKFERPNRPTSGVKNAAFSQ